MPALLCLLLALLAPAAEGRTLDRQTFRLHKTGTAEALVEVPQAGLLTVRAEVRRPFPTIGLQLVIETPEGLLFERQDSAPLTLERTVAASATGVYKVRVRNVSNVGGVEGRLTIKLEPQDVPEASPEAAPEPAPKAEAPAPKVVAPPPSKGRREGRQLIPITERQRLRAVCSDANTDLAVRLDLEAGTAHLELADRPFTSLEPQRRGALVELQPLSPAPNAAPLMLDLEGERLYFANSPNALCRVRFYF